MIANELTGLDERRKRLGMSCAILAKRSGVSLSVVQRILSGRHPNASYANVRAVAGALGVDFSKVIADDIEEFRRGQAARKARWIIGIVQGNAALEAQSVDAQAVQDVVARTANELLSGSQHALWSE